MRAVTINCESTLPGLTETEVPRWLKIHGTWSACNWRQNAVISRHPVSRRKVHAVGSGAY